MPKQQNLIKTTIRNIEVYRLRKSGKSVCNIAKLFELPEEEINAIIEAHRVFDVPNGNELLILKKQLFNVASSYRESVEISTLLSSASEKINRAEEIIKNLNGAKSQCH